MDPENLCREQLELVHEFDPAAQSDGKGVHTFTIAESPTGSGYVGFAGPVMDGPIDRWTSTNLETWQRTPRTPVLERSKLRWPTVLWEDGDLFMVARGAHRGPIAKLQTYVRRAKGKIPGLEATEPMRIDLYRSEDGRKFSRQQELVGPDQTGFPYNRNPFLFRDPVSNQIGLLYYTGTFSHFEIRLRLANDVPGLVDGGEAVLVESDKILAAPALWYDDEAGEYMLFCETFDESSNVWATDVFRSAEMRQGFDVHTGTRIFSDNRACAFPYEFEGQLYITVSHCTGDVGYGGIDSQWIGEIYRCPAD